MNRFLATAFAVGMLCAASAGAQTFAYAINSDGADAGSSGAAGDDLYRIDLTSGAAVRIGMVGAEDVEGLAFDAAGNLLGVDDAKKTTLSLNISNGRGSAIAGILGNTRLSVSDLGQDPSLARLCSGDVVGVAKNARTLYRVNLATGAFDVRGTVGLTVGKITDMTVLNDVLYGLGEDALYRINQQTGEATLVGNYGAGINFSDGGGLAADKTGTLWAVAERYAANGDVTNSQIYRINPSTGAATAGAMTIAGLESLAINESSCQVLAPVVPAAVPSLSLAGYLMMIMGVLVVVRRYS